MPGLLPERMVIFPGKTEEILSRAVGFLPWGKGLGQADGRGEGLIQGRVGRSWTGELIPGG